VRTRRPARMGSILFLLLAAAACSSGATPSPAAVASGARPATPSPSPTAPTTPSPTPGPTQNPRPTAPAAIEPGPKMTVARQGQAAVRLDDGRVLIIGGTVPFTGTCAMACIAPATASVEIYDPGTGKFSPNGSLAGPRTGGQALLLGDGRVLVSGGQGEFGEYAGTIEIYDPAKGASVVAGLPANLKQLAEESTAVLLADGRILIAGGSYDSYNSTSDGTIIFDPTSGAFGDGPRMAKPRQGATATLLADGRVLLSGGSYSKGYYGYMNDDSEVLDPSHPLSHSTLLAPQHLTGPTLLPDGRILFAGEGSYDSAVGCSTPLVPQVFDTKTEKSAPTGPMTTPRTGSTARRIEDGRVLFFGGVDASCAAADTVEAFDPGSGTFQVIPTGFPKISDFSATLLADGKILIAGGSSTDWNAMTADSWILKP
jgi:hypothetical protein